MSTPTSKRPCVGSKNFLRVGLSVVMRKEISSAIVKQAGGKFHVFLVTGDAENGNVQELSLLTTCSFQTAKTAVDGVVSLLNQEIETDAFVEMIDTLWLASLESEQVSAPNNIMLATSEMRRPPPPVFMFGAQPSSF